ncbi:MAG: hypothetical protein KDC99_00345 [Cyclobacteriaceae bacterium]|nr:hypothetical protein [Cyclobacteriaceae bacterium]
MELETYFLITYTLRYTSLAVALIGLFRWSRLSSPLKIFTILKVLSFLSDFVAGEVLRPQKIIQNHASSVYQMFELLLILWMYYLVLANKKLRIPFTIGAILLTLFGLINWIFIQKAEINSYTFTIDSLILLVVVIYYFHWLVATEKKSLSINNSFYWVSTGLAIYFSATILLFAAIDYIKLTMIDNLIFFLAFHNIMGIIANLFFFYGLWIAGRTKPDAPSPAS